MFSFPLQSSMITPYHIIPKELLAKGPNQSCIWYDTDLTILSCYLWKAAGYKIIVSVIPKEGLWGPACQFFSWYDNNTDLHRCIFAAHDAMHTANSKAGL